MNEFFDADKIFKTGVEKINNALEKFPELIIEVRKKYALLLPKLKTLREEVKELEKRKDKLADDCKEYSVKIPKLRQIESVLRIKLINAKDRHDEAISESKRVFKKESDVTRHLLNEQAAELDVRAENLAKYKKEVKKRLLTAKRMQETARSKKKEMEDRIGELQKKEIALSKKKMKFEKNRLEIERKQSGKSDAIDKAVMKAIAKKDVALQEREAVVTFKEKAFGKKKLELDKRDRALKVEEIRLKDRIKTLEAHQ